MKSVSDFFNGFIRFLGLHDEHPSQRKNNKRNRVFDDYSSDDDETPVTAQQSKKFRWSDIASIDDHDRGFKHHRSVRIVPIQRTSSPYAPSTLQKSSKRAMPIDLPGLSRNPSPPLNTEIDGDLEQEDSDVAKVESTSENKRNKPCILNVDSDEDDNDEVVFVKEVATPRTKPLKNSQSRNSHASDVKDKFLTSLSEAIKSHDLLEYRELLQRIENTIMSKEKPFVDTNRAEDVASFRTPQKTQLNIHDDDRHQNTPQEHETIKVSLTDTSDSDDDVEILPAAPTSTSPIKTNAKKFEELSKKWLLELDTVYNNNHRKNQDNKANSEHNTACSHGRDETDGSNDVLVTLAPTYKIRELHNKPKIQKTQEKHNDSRRASDSTPYGNSEKNEAGSSKRETVGDWLAKINEKYFPKTRKTPDQLDMHHESNILPNLSEQNETHSHKPEGPEDARDRLLKQEFKNKKDLLKSYEKPDAPLESTKEWLKGLEAKYFPTQDNLSNVCRESDIVSKVNGEENAVSSINHNTSGEPLRKGSEYGTVLLETQEKRDRESDMSKANSEKSEARSYLPAASRDWLAQLEAQYETPSQNSQASLSIARQKLNKILKENGERTEIRSVQLDSTDDWIDELRARYNKVQRNRREELNDARQKLNNENKHTTSHNLDSTEERPSLTSKHKTEQKNTQENSKNTYPEVNNLTKLDSEQNKALKFNTSEELMSKLGSLFNKYHQETDNISNKSIEEIDVESQSNDLPVLTPEQEEMVDEAFEPEPEAELLVERFNMRIHRRDIQTLAGLNWLNDEVINFYMNLIMQRSEDRKDLPRVYATNTFFYPKLMQSGQAGLRRWTRKVDIFAYELFMVPVNIGHHWCLSIVDFRSCVIKYLDSQGIPNQECLDALLQYLTDEHRDKKGELFNANCWMMKFIKGIPQQMNGSDCGMFACTFAEFASRDAPFTFTQAHMPYLRRKAALEILMGKLLL